MQRIETLEELVRGQYAAQNQGRADWADWLGDNHVFLVADHAEELALRFGAEPELARASALLHDIADTTMSRFSPDHEMASLLLAHDLLEQSGFTKGEIELIVDDAIRYHSCHDGKVPHSLEGKVLATADSIAHLRSDFYIYATWALASEKALVEIKQWVLKKLERDYHNKILFSEVRHECESDYLALKKLYSR